jgi:hypothetical protein
MASPRRALPPATSTLLGHPALREWEAAALAEDFRDPPHEAELAQIGTVTADLRVPATVKAPELLAPAGSLQMARTALDFGADAIYAGQPRYSLRVRNNDFGTLDNLAAAIAATHARRQGSTSSATSCRTTPSSRPTSTTWRR